MKDFKKIYEMFSVSSAEKETNEYFKESFKDTTYQLEEDRLYSIFLTKKSSNSGEIKLMLASPLDEYGLMVKDVTDKEKIGFVFLEDISPLAYINQRVKILTRDGQILKGIVTLDRKFVEETGTSFEAEDLYIDLIEEDRDKVAIGDLVSLDSPLLINNDYIVGKSLNQKIFQYLIMKLLREMEERTFSYDLSMGVIAQSTIGFRGTETASHVVDPSHALALTGFEVNKSSPQINLGDGPIISYYDSKLLPDQEFLNLLQAHFDLKPYMGLRPNDGSFIHKTLDGAKTLALGIPIKNLGTANEVASLKDVERLYQFLVDLLEKMEDLRI